MEEKKYLYRNERFSRGVSRYLVTRESEKSYWIYINEHYEERIPKKTMSTGSGWDRTYYYEETEKFKERYRFQVKCYKYSKKLDKLKKCDDERIMDIVLDIDITGDSK